MCGRLCFCECSEWRLACTDVRSLNFCPCPLLSDCTWKQHQHNCVAIPLRTSWVWKGGSFQWVSSQLVTSHSAFCYALCKNVGVNDLYDISVRENIDLQTRIYGFNSVGSTVSIKTCFQPTVKDRSSFVKVLNTSEWDASNCILAALLLMTLQQGKSSKGDQESIELWLELLVGRRKETWIQAVPRPRSVLAGHRGFPWTHERVESPQLSSNGQCEIVERRLRGSLTQIHCFCCVKPQLFGRWGILLWSLAIAIWTVRTSGRLSSVMN